MTIKPEVLDALLAAGATAQELADVCKADYAEQQERNARKVPWQKLRQLAFERDGECCQYCGCAEPPFEIDHVIPRVRGGENILSNVVVACRRCNRSKKDREGPKR